MPIKTNKSYSLYNPRLRHTVVDLLENGFYLSPISDLCHVNIESINKVYKGLKNCEGIEDKIKILKDDEKYSNEDTLKTYRRVILKSYSCTQDIIDISLFTRIYTSLVGERFLTQIDVPSLIDAFTLYAQQISPKDVSETYVKDINIAYKLIKEAICTGSSIHECHHCHSLFYYRVSVPNALGGRKINCPFCYLKENYK